MRHPLKVLVAGFAVAASGIGCTRILTGNADARMDAPGRDGSSDSSPNDAAARDAAGLDATVRDSTDLASTGDTAHDGMQAIFDGAVASDGPPAIDQSGGGCRAGDPSGVDTWVWDNAMATAPSGRAALWKFAAKKQVRTVYLSAATLLANDPKTLTDFVTEAGQNGVSVELLLSDYTWSLTVNHPAAIALTQKAVAFIESYVGQKPIGLHFDVEPHTLPEFKTDQNGTANQFIDLLEKIRAITAPAGVRTTFDVAYWYPSRMITRNNATRPFSEWIIDRVDRIAIMDYRNTSQLVASSAAAELAYAAKTCKRAVVGVSVKCSGDATTFCGLGEAAMRGAFDATRAAYPGNSALDGFAVHAYLYWETLGP